MYLDQNQIRRSVTFHKFLKKQSSEYFKKTGIYKCPDCNGTGLAGLYQHESGDYSWDTYSYCNSCHGVGFRNLIGGIQIDDTHFLCKNCEGVGCKYCENGIVDWVTHAMGSDK